MLHFVTSLEDGIHCNLFSKCGRLQTVEVKRFLEAAVAQELTIDTKCTSCKLQTDTNTLKKLNVQINKNNYFKEWVDGSK